MFPLCLINASVTDAGRIRSRLVSFPLTLFSSVCHIAFPMVLFKKQTCSLFIIPTWPPLLFFCFFSPHIVFVVVHFRQPHLKLKCQTATALSNSRLLVWRGFCSAPLLRFAPNSSSVTHYFTFINLTHQSRWLHRDRIQEVTFFFLSLSLRVCWGCKWEESFLGGFWRLFGRPEIKLSAAGPVLHCWEEHRGPNEMHVSSIKGAGCVSSSPT